MCGAKVKEPLSARDIRIFQSVIREYILTAEPVSSRKIARHYGLNLSPATIRNVMADLEDMGFLYQPHTSAGRVPTNRGFRLYVDSIVASTELSLPSKHAIEEKYRKASGELSSLMRETSRILSEFSHGTGIVMAPRFIDRVFRRIDFVLLRKGQILAVFVSQTGLVQNTVIELEEIAVTQDDLDKFSRYLNEILGGLTLRQVRQKILQEMREEENRYDAICYRALQLGQTVLSADYEAEVYVEGQDNLLDYPELAKAPKFKVLLNAFEKKSILLTILDKAMDAEGLHIVIGPENELQEMEDISFVLSPYAREQDILGSLGVVGPTRMNYLTIVPIVDYIAKVLSDHLKAL
jgi:heat-inducible transcriptional repressor